MKGKIYRTECSIFDVPAWYWSHELHDAEILQVNQLNISDDYKTSNSRRTCFEIILDASGALFDRDVKVLRFFNYKVISGDPDIANRRWMCDSLSQHDGKYVLKITTNDWKVDSKLILQFEDAEIVRQPTD